MTPDPKTSGDFPIIRMGGFDAMLVSFDGQLSETGNRAALAFSAAVTSAGWSGLQEVSSSLVSVCIRFDPLTLSHEHLKRELQTLLAQRNWYEVPLPEGRRLWRVPTVFGGDLAPQLAEAADIAGLSEAEAIQSLSEARVRVQTIGFAPGQPYLGRLPKAWDIPRQSTLTKQVPIGALCVAIRQLVLFSGSTPTGWRHVGQTGVNLFRPQSDAPFALRPGDEMQFYPVTPEDLQALQDDPMGGATCVDIP